MAIDRIRIAKVLIRRRSDGRYLMLRGSVWPERPDRSQKPDLPGGMVDPGESYEQGAVREVLEEAGVEITAEQLTLVYADSYLREDVPESVNRLVYLAEVADDPAVTLSWEHEDYEWISQEEVLALDIRAPYPEIFQYLARIEYLV